MHENYIVPRELNIFNKFPKRIAFNTYEGLFVRKEMKFNKEYKRALGFVQNRPFGIEIDCNAIENISSIDMAPTGLSVSKTRELLHHMAKHKNAIYLHICGAAPDLAPKKISKLTAKFVAFLITDFLRANGS